VGSYTVTLKVTDEEGMTAEASHLVAIADAPPLSAFSINTSSPTAGQPIAFDGSASSDPDGSIASYEWDFGDGSHGTGPTPSHIYAHAGSYSATLTVTDDRGKTGEVSHLINVAGAPPETTIYKRRVKSGKRMATFRFGSSDPSATFRCKLDSRHFAACSSPKTYRHLRSGRHTFAVDAVDATGNEDPTPAIMRFTVPQQTQTRAQAQPLILQGFGCSAPAERRCCRIGGRPCMALHGSLGGSALL
jgi:hypothetical protein